LFWINFGNDTAETLCLICAFLPLSFYRWQSSAIFNAKHPEN